jgi:hypothetical protein
MRQKPRDCHELLPLDNRIMALLTPGIDRQDELSCKICVALWASEPTFHSQG